MVKQQRNKKIIVVSIILGTVLIIGVFWLGRISGKSQSAKQKNYPNPNQPIDNPPKPNLPPDLTFPNDDSNRLKFATSYLAELGKSYIYNVHDSNETILVDKKNLLFAGKLIKELTNKSNHYIFSFSPAHAEKYHNQDGTYYFSERNDNFSVMIKILNPTNLGSKSEGKFAYIGITDGDDYFCFSNSILPETTTENNRAIFVSKSHPRIKELLKQRKIEREKYFIIRYGTPSMIDKSGKYVYEEFNQELEIAEI